MSGSVSTRTRTRSRRLRMPKNVLALPAWFYLLFFFVAPVALVFWYSFGRKPDLFTTHDNSDLTLDRYHEVIHGVFFDTFENTLRVAVLGTLLCLLIGFPFAYWLAVKVSPSRRGLLLAVVIIPYWTNFLVRTIGWRIILAPDGIAYKVLSFLHLRDTPLAILDTRSAVQLGVVYNYLPLMILPIFVALDRMDPALREASNDLGANRWRTLRQVTIPLARPGIAAGLLLVFIPLMGDYITATVLGGAKGNMAGQLVASEFQQSQNWARGSAEAVVLIVVILAVTAICALAWFVVHRIGESMRRIRIEPGGASG